jgi:thiamine-phosphate pyrophosphorylase
MRGGARLAERLALIVVTDAACGEGRELVEVVRAALAGGAPAVQLRAKHEPTRAMVELALRLAEETRRAGALLFVNDRLDVALAAGADGVHLGDDDLPLPAARRLAPPEFLIGRSVATPREAAQAVREGADYLGVGPVFATLSKADAGDAIGAEGVRAVCSVAGGVPVVGIGGIDAGNAGVVAGAGAAGVAVIRAVMLAADPRAAAAELLRGLREG